MIFVTVGTELPFNRMVQVVDQWATDSRRSDVFAQIGRSEWKPRAIEYQEFLEPADYASCFARAKIVIAHAGMGTILSALHLLKPILVVPRRASLGEHRNEHQLATARRMLAMGKVKVAFDEGELRHWLDRIDSLVAHEQIAPYADNQLIASIRDYIGEIAR